MTRDLGDFQTPIALAEQVVKRVGGEWARVLEPACGRGTFLGALSKLPTPPREVIGIELQPQHLADAQVAASVLIGVSTRVIQASVFDLDLRRELAWRHQGPLLVIGNPPWITSAELGQLNSPNVPRKENLKALPGIAAITGAANFDLTEYIILKVLKELHDEQPTIALLCKTSVARAVLRHTAQVEARIASARIYRIDAKRWFRAAVDACLFVVQTGSPPYELRVPVFPAIEAEVEESTILVRSGGLIADAARYARVAHLEGSSPVVWRQGVKHDASTVMELVEAADGTLVNRLGEAVDVELEYLFPLVKGTALFHGSKPVPPQWVIVPQRRLGEDTIGLVNRAPRLWSYLQAHRDHFERRKSSIYRRQPPFAIFGVGEYTFASFKVCVSGLHKQPRFRAVGPIKGKPCVLDDTCYFVPCASAQQAAVIAALLESEPAQDLLRSLTFLDAKRPVTKALLQRVNLVAVAGAVDARRLAEAAEKQLLDAGYAQPPAQRLSQIGEVLLDLPLFQAAF